MNQYGFAEGNPVMFSDPFGLCPPKDKNPCNRNTGDKNIDDPVVRQKLEDAYFSAPEVAGHPGYVAEVGGWCASDQTCSSRTDNSLTEVWLGPKPQNPTLAYHTHGNAGKLAIDGGPDDYYSERWSRRDAENAATRTIPSYIIGPWHIIRLTPRSDGNVDWQRFDRWTKPCGCVPPPPQTKPPKP